MTEPGAQQFMFSQPPRLEVRSPVARWGLGLIANAFLLAIISYLGPMANHYEELGQGRKWVSLKALPVSPDPIQFTRPVTARPRPEVARKAILPDLQNRPSPVAKSHTELPSPPVLASISKQPASIFLGPTPPLPAPPPPKPVLGEFSGGEIMGSIPKIKQPLAFEVAGFHSEAAPSIKQRESAEVQRAFEEVHPNPRSSRVRQTMQDSTFSSTVLIRPADQGDRRVVQTTFGRSETGARSVRTESAALVSNTFDSRPAESQRQRKLNHDAEPPGFKPVEILSKPRALYTEQARKLGIEGDVRVRVLFGADGKLKVMEIVGSLGYGLDENAAVAASQILFRPATRMGEPVEQSAIVRVQFQLAN